MCSAHLRGITHLGVSVYVCNYSRHLATASYISPFPFPHPRLIVVPHPRASISCTKSSTGFSATSKETASAVLCLVGIATNVSFETHISYLRVTDPAGGPHEEGDTRLEVPLCRRDYCTCIPDTLTTASVHPCHERENSPDEVSRRRGGAL